MLNYILQYHTKYSEYCQKFYWSFRHFTFTLKDNYDFNYINIDNIYIEGKPVLYLVNKTI